MSIIIPSVIQARQKMMSSKSEVMDAARVRSCHPFCRIGTPRNPNPAITKPPTVRLHSTVPIPRVTCASKPSGVKIHERVNTKGHSGAPGLGGGAGEAYDA